MQRFSRKAFLHGLGLGVAGATLGGRSNIANAMADQPRANTAAAPVAGPIAGYQAPRMGAFAEPPMAGFFEFNASDMLPTSQYFNLTQGETWLYAYLRGEDSNEIDLITTFSGGTCSGMLMRVEDMNDPRAYEKRDPRSDRFLNGGRVRFEDKQGDLVITGTNFASALSQVRSAVMNVKIGKQDFAWLEPGIVDLKGTIIGPGMHHHQPWRDGEKVGGTYYVSVLYRVTGTLFGKAYQGWAGIDQSYQPEGVSWGQGMEAGRDQALWGIFAQELDDGTIQYGQMSRGVGTFNFSMLSDGNRRYSADVVKTDISLRPNDGYVDKARFYLSNGEQWEFVNRMGQMSFGDFRSQSGIIRKVGDTRNVRSWYCIFESFPSRIRQHLL